MAGISVIAQSSNNYNNEWQLIWQDEFNEETLNEAKWSKIPRGKSEWNKYMSDDSLLYEIKESNLILRGVVNENLLNDTAKFLTAGVYSKNRFSVQYGRIEICARLENAQGAWPALWMLPQEDIKWPDGGEIDIMEHLNYDNIFYQTVHSYYTYVLNEKTNPPSHAVVEFDRSVYNIFAVEKYSDKLVFYLNGNKTFEYKNINIDDSKGQFPFDTPYYILMDMQLGGNWVGPINKSQLPVAMYIDWVRVYQ